MDLLEGKPELGALVSPDAKLSDALNKLFKVDLPVAVFVKDVYDPLDQRVLLKLWQRHELFHAQRSGIVLRMKTDESGKSQKNTPFCFGPGNHFFPFPPPGWLKSVTKRPPDTF
jgi:hypothetical protein